MSFDHPDKQHSTDNGIFKNIIVCCDGTGKAASHGVSVVPTNVFRFAQALRVAPDSKGPDGLTRETEQVVLYQAGVGTDAGLTSVGSLFGEAFGHGLDIHVLEAYHFFSNNYEKGDKLFLFGFSRGAFTARAIASFIINVGLLRKENLNYLPPIYEEYKNNFRPDRQDNWDAWLKVNRPTILELIHENVEIPIIGLWDTVGSLGLPETRLSKYLSWLHLRNWINDQYAYHDMTLASHEIDPFVPRVLHAYQALALDEHRLSFSPTLLTSTSKRRTPEERVKRIEEDEHYPIIEQCWFPGVHTDIGGGYARGAYDISDLSLAWMIDRCQPYLKIQSRTLDSAFKNASTGFEKGTLNAKKMQDLYKQDLVENRWGLSALNDEYKRKTMWKIGGSKARTPGEYFLGKTENRDGKEVPIRTNEYFHPSIRLRFLENANPQDPKWKKYEPHSLAGFKLKKAPDPQGHMTWVWTKDITVKGVKYTIEIPELKIDPVHGKTRESKLINAAPGHDTGVGAFGVEKQDDEVVNPQLAKIPTTWFGTIAGWFKGLVGGS